MARPARDPGIDGPRDTVSATPPPTPGFLAIPIDSGAPFRRLVNQLGPERLTLFLKLNRVDLAQVRAGDTLLLPADSTTGALALAPFPTRLPVLDSVPKLLAVSLRVQAFAAYDSGRLVIWGPTSTGKRHHAEPHGTFPRQLEGPGDAQHRQRGVAATLVREHPEPAGDLAP